MSSFVQRCLCRFHCSCYCLHHHRQNNPPSLPGMHPTTGWLLCQKMRSSLSLPLGSLSSSLSESTLSPAIVVAVVIVVKNTPPPSSLPVMHQTTGWLLCQKMRSSLSSPLGSSSLSSSESTLSPAIVVAVVIVVEIPTPPCQECIYPTTGWLLCQKMRSTLSLHPHHHRSRPRQRCHGACKITLAMTMSRGLLLLLLVVVGGGG